ncbi:MAG: NAD(P)H-dependent oxidoreductase [Eubacteriales bacterium]
MKLLHIDGCVRTSASRTLALTQHFLGKLSENCAKTGQPLETETLTLGELSISHFVGESLKIRDNLIKKGELSHENFDLSHQFADADILVISAPFWDLSLPAVVKVYIENISVQGITFDIDDSGLFGLCKARHLVYVTTRGAFYQGGELDIGSKYLEALCKMYGIDNFHTVFAEGTDIATLDLQKIMEEGRERADAVAQTISAQK